MVRSRLPRAVLAAIAVLLAAWFTVLARDQWIGQQAESRIYHHFDMSDAEWEHSMEQLRQAELFNPGMEWRVTRARWLLLRGRRPEALNLAESVVRREPDNLRAWTLVFNATRGRHSRRSVQALAEIRRLNPPLARP